MSDQRGDRLCETFEEAAAVIAEAGMASASPLTLPLDEARDRQARYFAFLAQDPPAVGGVEDFVIEGPVGEIPMRLYWPDGAGPHPVIVYVRGSGWWTGSLDSHDRTMRAIVRESGYAVCGVDYRCTPEFKCPVQRNELIAAVAHLAGQARSNKIMPAAIILWGESAGATLSLAATQALRDAALPMPCGLVLMYGNFAGPQPASRDYSRWVWQQYLTGSAQAHDPAAVPLLGDMAELPPVWLGVGERDPLIADSGALAAKLDAAGVPHEMRLYSGMPHAFCMFTRFLEPANRAIRDGAVATRRFVAAVDPQKRGGTS